MNAAVAEGLTLTWIVTVALVETLRLPSAHVTMPLACVQVGGPGVEETNATWLGSVSVTAMPGDVEGPRFVIRIV